MLTLPAASLTAPWCYLCVAGIKTLETRKGALLSGFTGPLVICRTKAPPVDYDLSRFGVTLPPVPYEEDDRGMAIGIVFVKRTWRYLGLFAANDANIMNRACYHDVANRYLSELTHAAWFPHPVKAHGQQGRFRVEVPVEYVPGWAQPDGRESAPGEVQNG